MIDRRALKAAFAAATLAFASSVPADSADHLQEVRTLFRLTRMEAKVSESVDSLLALQIRQSPELRVHEPALRRFLERHIGWEAMRPDLEAMYMEAFAADELRQMNAFYITPVGQKVLTRVPELVQVRNQLAARRLQEHIGELQREIDAGDEGR